MSTPVCLANAVADALGIADVQLPMTPAKLAVYIHAAEQAPPARVAEAASEGGRALHGSGEAEIAAAPDRIWQALLDPNTLASIIPGAHGVEKISESEFHADVTLGVGPVKGRYQAKITLSDLDPPHAVVLSGRVTGLLGTGSGTGHIRLRKEDEDRTRLSYEYEAKIGGKIASVGGRLLDGAARFVIRQFFQALSRRLGGDEQTDRSWLGRLRTMIGGRA
jgi:2-furoyl-CoA dehydrogenase large subunit